MNTPYESCCCVEGQYLPSGAKVGECTNITGMLLMTHSTRMQGPATNSVGGWEQKSIRQEVMKVEQHVSPVDNTSCNYLPSLAMDGYNIHCKDCKSTMWTISLVKHVLSFSITGKQSTLHELSGCRFPLFYQVAVRHT